MDTLRLAARRLAQRPAATIAAVLTLASAIAAAAATWSLLSAVLLRPVAVRDPATLVLIGNRQTTGLFAGTLYEAFDYPYYPLIRDSGIFQDVVANWSTLERLPVRATGAATPTPVAFATHDFFTVLGVPMALGRGFSAADDRRGTPLVALLTDRGWHRAFNADPAAVGRTITVSGTSATIVGVLPRGFRGYDLSASPDLYLPLQTIAEVGGPFTNYFADPNHPSSPTAGLAIVARLRPRTSARVAIDRLLALPVPSVVKTRPSFELTPLETAAVPQAMRGAMRQFTGLLATTVALLLLIGCSGVGMLLLIRTEARRQEFATCLALGASRGRLALGVTIEGALLSLAGAAGALPLARWLLTVVRAFRLPGGVDIDLLDLSVDRGVVAAAIVCAVAATLVIAAIASASGFPRSIAEALRSHGGNAPATRRRTRSVLVVAQVAIALVLVAGAGLFARSLISALQLNTGLGADHLLTMSVRLDTFGRPTPRDSSFYADAVRRLKAAPGIADVAVDANQGGMRGALAIDGVPRQFPSMVAFDAVDSRYFRTMRMPILEGRGFASDDRADSPPVTIVSQSLARAISPDGHPLGRRITMPFHRNGQPPIVAEVIGVVPDVITNVSTLEPLSMYFPMAQASVGSGRTIDVRATGSVEAARRDLADVLRQIDPSVTPGPILTLQGQIGREMSAQRFGATVLGALGAIAMLLTIVGVYVLAESMAVLRTREMGIRAALGATRLQLAGLVLGQSARLVGVGTLCGFGLAYAGARMIRLFLFRVQPLDPLTLGSVALLILILTIVVSLRPAIRVGRLDLAAVLKQE